VIAPSEAALAAAATLAGLTLVPEDGGTILRFPPGI
jgi:hypothetical protein